MNVCIIEGCDRTAMARGWCSRHYARWRKTGDPLGSVPRHQAPTCSAVGCNAKNHAHGRCANHQIRKRQAPKLRTQQILRQIDKTGSCWLWRGTMQHGYGRFHFRGEAAQAHRVVYELYRGPIPDGLVLDHLCRNTRCVNPDHLEPVTIAENVLRGVGAPAQNARKTHCKWGHELSGDNVIVRSDGRECRACARENKRLSELRRKLAQSVPTVTWGVQRVETGMFDGVTEPTRVGDLIVVRDDDLESFVFALAEAWSAAS